MCVFIEKVQNNSIFFVFFLKKDSFQTDFNPKISPKYQKFFPSNQIALQNNRIQRKNIQMDDTQFSKKETRLLFCKNFQIEGHVLFRANLLNVDFEQIEISEKHKTYQMFGRNVVFFM